MIVFWAIENNLVYLREDRSDCDKFLPGRHIVVIFLLRLTLLASQSTGFLICISYIKYVTIANYILRKEFWVHEVLRIL